MRSAADPLALEPLGPMGPIADAYPPQAPLTLDPLSPESKRQGPGTADGKSEVTSER
jgi:hypothetical protein